MHEVRGAGRGPTALQSREADWQAYSLLLQAYRGGVMGGCTIRWGNGHCPVHVAVGGGGPLGFRQLAGPGALSLRRRACNKSPVF